MPGLTTKLRVLVEVGKVGMMRTFLRYFPRAQRMKVQAVPTLPFLVNFPHGLALICENLSEFIRDYCDKVPRTLSWFRGGYDTLIWCG